MVHIKIHLLMLFPLGVKPIICLFLMPQLRQVYVFPPFLWFEILTLQNRKNLCLILLLKPHISRDWTDTLFLCLPQQWKYYLNRGSEVNISYSLSSENSSLYLVIAEGIRSKMRFQWFLCNFMNLFLVQLPPTCHLVRFCIRVWQAWLWMILIP